MTALPKLSITVKLTTGGLAIVTLVIVTVGCNSAHACALVAIAVGSVSALLPTFDAPPPPGAPGVPGVPGGPAGPAGPGGPAGPAGPPSPPQPARDAAIAVAAAIASQYGSRCLPIAVLPLASSDRRIIQRPYAVTKVA